LAAPEIAYVINDAEAKLLFVGAEFLPLVQRIRDELTTVEKVIVVGGTDDEYEGWLAAHEPLDTTREAQPDECFLQLYTSGTTGFPKGAMLTHTGMTAHSQATAADAHIDANAHVMVAMPLFHVGGSSFALTGLYFGARIVVVRELDPVSFLDELVAEQITHVFVVPAVLGFLVQVPGVADRDYAHLKAMIYGASPMPLPLLRRCLELFPTDFYQVYGMTEASGAVTSLGPAEHRDRANDHRLASAGKAAPGVELAVVDPLTGEHLGPDATGEVWVRTRQLMAGYWHKPEASREALVAEGWLRSGDVGQLDADGYLYISDRVKDLIISGGENIYPAEIERVLVEHPDVAEVAVIGVPDERWGEVPKAIVVASTEAPEAEKLLAHCHDQLASFKCPKSVEFVAALPRNPTGKVLKRELRAPYWPAEDVTR
jgi:acyl-CoA synthetase (AMP-forming)/AMP-acid ligase II